MRAIADDADKSVVPRSRAGYDVHIVIIHRATITAKEDQARLWALSISACTHQPPSISDRQDVTAPSTSRGEPAAKIVRKLTIRASTRGPEVIHEVHDGGHRTRLAFTAPGATVHICPPLSQTE